MAEPSSQQNPWVLWPVLAVFLVVGGYIQLMPRLDSTRPIGEKAAVDKAEGGHTVRARLWEDPLAAVEEGAGPLSKDQAGAAFIAASAAPGATDLAGRANAQRKEGSSHGPDDSLKDTLGEFKDGNKLVSGTQILVLLAMVDNGPYPEDLETRRRTRNAVVSGAGCRGVCPA